MAVGQGHALGCDCCGGQQIMAVEYHDRVVIKARHHGRDHVLVLNKADLDITTNLTYRDRLRDLVMGSTN